MFRIFLFVRVDLRNFLPRIHFLLTCSRTLRNAHSSEEIDEILFPYITKEIFKDYRPMIRFFYDVGKFLTGFTVGLTIL